MTKQEANKAYHKERMKKHKHISAYISNEMMEEMNERIAFLDNKGIYTMSEYIRWLIERDLEYRRDDLDDQILRQEWKGLGFKDESALGVFLQALEPNALFRLMPYEKANVIDDFRKRFVHDKN